MISKKWMTVLGTTVLAGVLATGVAFAAGGDAPLQAVSKLSPGMQSLMKDIRSLREKRMQELKSEVEGLIDKAQAEGKITADEATKLKERGARGHFKGHRGGHGFKGGKGFPMTEEEMKARLDQAVKNGRITQEQADQMLKKWQEWNASKQTDKQG